MKPNELFTFLRTAKYIKSEMDLDWMIYVNKSEKRVMLCFQESVSSYDWKINFSFPAKLYKQQENKIWVARGWGKVWKANNDEIMEEFIKQCNEHPDYETMTCGFSYGGAMAQLAAEEYRYRTGKKLDLMVTFGSPKPLFFRSTQKYFISCVSKIKQFCSPNDIVTKCVPFPLYFRMATNKVGKKVFFGIFNPMKWHLSYDNKDYYNEEV